MKGKDNVKVKKVDGGTFFLRLEEGSLDNNDILSIGPTMKTKVVKVYKFNWWRRFLYKLGFSFKHADLIQILDNGTPDKNYTNRYIAGIDEYNKDESSTSKGASFPL